MPFTKERLRGLLKAKGRDETHLAEKFGQSRAHSWMSGTRKPRADTVGFQLAAWLEVAIEYLYGQAPELEAMSYEKVAARASLAIYLKRDRDNIASDLDRLYEMFALSPASPRTVDDWAALTKDIIEPSFQFAVERHVTLERMQRRSSSAGSKQTK